MAPGFCHSVPARSRVQPASSRVSETITALIGFLQSKRVRGYYKPDPGSPAPPIGRFALRFESRPRGSLIFRLAFDGTNPATLRRRGGRTMALETMIAYAAGLGLPL